MKIGRLIENYRVMNRLEQKTVAAEIGVSPGVLGRIERGESVQGESLVKVWAWTFGDDAPVQPDLLQIEGPRG